jgi:hypothetical protein
MGFGIQIGPGKAPLAGVLGPGGAAAKVDLLGRCHLAVTTHGTWRPSTGSRILTPGGMARSQSVSHAADSNLPPVALLQ